MAKKSKMKAMPIQSLAVIVLSALVLTLLFLPVISMTAGALGLSGDAEPYTAGKLLAGLGVNDENIGDKSAEEIATRVLFFSENGENSGLAKFFTIMCLVSFVLGVLTILAAVASIFMKNDGKILKGSVVLQLLAVIVTFILAIVMTSKFSGQILLVTYTAALGIGAILPLVGAVLAAVVPFVKLGKK
jgi:hypothetical protein